VIFSLGPAGPDESCSFVWLCWNVFLPDSCLSLHLSKLACEWKKLNHGGVVVVAG
jgi:hypothetical protein